jgi:aspergillopepsin I
VDVSRGDWTITVDGYAIGDDTTTSSVMVTGDIDTGSSLMALPTKIAEAYYGQIPGAQYDQKRLGGYAFPCNSTLPDFSLYFSGKKRTG